MAPNGPYMMFLSRGEIYFSLIMSLNTSIKSILRLSFIAYRHDDKKESFSPVFNIKKKKNNEIFVFAFVDNIVVNTLVFLLYPKKKCGFVDRWAPVHLESRQSMTATRMSKHAVVFFPIYDIYSAVKS
jgi:hypothetical protein